MLAGNTADNTTLKGFLARIERQYGKARRVWLMDRGIPTEEVLGQMRSSEPPVQYVVGTPKGRLTSLERALLLKPWAAAPRKNRKAMPWPMPPPVTTATFPSKRIGNSRYSPESGSFVMTHKMRAGVSSAFRHA